MIRGPTNPVALTFFDITPVMLRCTFQASCARARVALLSRSCQSRRFLSYPDVSCYPRLSVSLSPGRVFSLSTATPSPEAAVTTIANAAALTSYAEMSSSRGAEGACEAVAASLSQVADTRILVAAAYAVQALLGGPAHSTSPAGAAVLLSALVARAGDLGQFSAAAAAWGVLRGAALRPVMGSFGIDAWLLRLINAGKAPEALVVLSRALELGAQPTPETLAAAVAACSAQDDFGAAQKWWQRLAFPPPGCSHQPVRPGLRAFNAYIHAAALAGRRREALNCLDRMRDVGVQPDAESYCGAMLAASYTGRPDLAFTLHDDMVRCGVAPTEASAYTCLLVAGHAADAGMLQVRRRRCAPPLHCSGVESAPLPSPPPLQDALAVLDDPALAGAAGAAAGGAAAGCLLSPRIYAAVSFAAAQAGDLRLCVDWLERSRAAARRREDGRQAAAASGDAVSGDPPPALPPSSAADRVAPYVAVMSAAASSIAQLLQLEQGGSDAGALERLAVCERAWAAMLEDGLTPTLEAVATMIRARALGGDRAHAAQLLQVCVWGGGVMRGMRLADVRLAARASAAHPRAVGRGRLRRQAGRVGVPPPHQNGRPQPPPPSPGRTHRSGGRSCLQRRHRGGRRAARRHEGPRHPARCRSV